MPAVVSPSGIGMNVSWASPGVPLLHFLVCRGVEPARSPRWVPYCSCAGFDRALDSMAKQTRVAILADLFPILSPHTSAKALSSIKLQEMADPLIDGGGFAALHLPGMFDLPAPAVSSRIVSSQGGSGPETPFRAVDVSERAKLCRRRAWSPAAPRRQPISSLLEIESLRDKRERASPWSECQLSCSKFVIVNGGCPIGRSPATTRSTHSD